MSDRYLVDTSVLFPIISPRHVQHTVARRYLVARAAAGDQMFVAAHSLAETYSVVTRVPGESRLPLAAAVALLNSLIGKATLIGLNPDQYVDILRNFPEHNVSGGAVYDALIIETAIQAGVDEAVTFNVRDFERLARARITVTRPALQ